MKPYSFIQKWKKAYEHLDIDFDISTYEEFYKNVRNSIIHASSEAQIENISNLNSKIVYLGFQAGWSAMEALSINIGEPFWRNSWEVLCKMDNLISPNQVEKLNDITKLARNLIKNAHDFFDKTR